MDANAAADVSCSVDVRLVDDAGMGLPLAACLSYAAADPYAVEAAFQAGETRVRWVFCRDLLTSGLQAPAGEGDVRVWPSFSPDGRRVLAIQLSSPDGEATLEVEESPLATFLHRTYVVVPVGDESDHLDLDSALARLLEDNEGKFA